MPSFSKPAIAELLLKAAAKVIGDPALAHHLAKASVERWFAFEMAHQLDELLKPSEWVTLVECGGGGDRHGERVGNFDLLLVPNQGTSRESRLRGGKWLPETIAIEVKCAHLADGELSKSSYPNALFDDVVTKPGVATNAGRPCAMILGVLVTTDGTWEGSPKAEKARELGDRVDACKLSLAKGLVRIPDEPPAVKAKLCSAGWSGRVWVEVVDAGGSFPPPR